MDAHTGPSEAKPLTHGEARLVIVGVLLPLFMGSIDNTILASALPTIGRDLGDVAAPKERGRYYAYFSIVYTTAGACGPALGGFISDHLHWSIIFWLNIPLGVLAFWVTSSLLGRLPRYERPHRLDVVGAILIVTASASFMLALNLGG